VVCLSKLQVLLLEGLDSDVAGAKPAWQMLPLKELC
jgi:hypothetical protein